MISDAALAAFDKIREKLEAEGMTWTDLGYQKWEVERVLWSRFEGPCSCGQTVVIDSRVDAELAELSGDAALYRFEEDLATLGLVGDWRARHDRAGHPPTVVHQGGRNEANEDDDEA